MTRFSALKHSAIAALAHLRCPYTDIFALPCATIGSDADRLLVAGKRKRTDPVLIAAAIAKHRPPAVIAGHFESVRYIDYGSTRAGRKFAFHQLRLKDSLGFAFHLTLGETVLMYLLNPAASEADELLKTAGTHGLSFLIAKPKGAADRITVRLSPDEVAQGIDFIAEARARPDKNKHFDVDVTDTNRFKGLPPISQVMYWGNQTVVQVCVVTTQATNAHRQWPAAPATFWGHAGKSRARAAFENRGTR